MLVNPRYNGPPIIDIFGEAPDQLIPFVRQRQRMMSLVKSLSHEQLHSPSRCDGWSVRDVIAHVGGVTDFWRMSVEGGKNLAPTQYLAEFDPVSVPDQMVIATRSKSATEILDHFVSSSENFIATLEGLNGDDWLSLAEAPPGYLPIRLVVMHALWDSWIHERDITQPLLLSSPIEPDEVGASLMYAAALSPALGATTGFAARGTYFLHASNPSLRLRVDVDDHVTISPSTSNIDDELRGNAVDLVEALSLRGPLPDSAPPAWRVLLSGLSNAFNAS